MFKLRYFKDPVFFLFTVAMVTAFIAAGFNIYQSKTGTGRFAISKPAPNPAALQQMVDGTYQYYDPVITKLHREVAARGSK